MTPRAPRPSTKRLRASAQTACVGCGRKHRRGPLPRYACAFCSKPLHRVCIIQHERTCAWQAGYEIGKAAGRNELLAELTATGDLHISQHLARLRASVAKPPGT